jgi:hypothetical protein
MQSSVYLNKEVGTYTDLFLTPYARVSHVLRELEKQPFEPDRMAIMIARGDREKAEGYKAEWKEANENGSKLSAEMQAFISFGEQPPTDHIYWRIMKLVLAELDGDSQLYCELPLSDDEYMIAGTPDLIAVENGTAHIFDWKLIKELKHTRTLKSTLKEPVSHLDECNYNKYCLQLAAYAVMIEKQGYTIGNLWLVVVHPVTFHITLRKLPYLKKEIIDVFQVFRHNQ